MNYEENVTFAQTSLAETGEALLALDDPTDHEIRRAILDVTIGAHQGHVVIDLHNGDTLHFKVPSFTERVLKVATRRWRMGKLNGDGAH